MEEQEPTGDNEDAPKNSPVTAGITATGEGDKPEQGHQEPHGGDRSAQDQPRPRNREGLSLLLSAIVAGSTLIYAAVSSCQLLVMRATLAEITSSNESSNRVATSAEKVAAASEKVATATVEWSTQSGRALREQNRLAGSAVAEARKQSASATRQADVAAQAVDESRQQAEASRKVFEQSVAIADKSLRETRRARIVVIGFDDFVDMSAGLVSVTVKFRNDGQTEAKYSISGEVQIDIAPTNRLLALGPRYRNDNNYGGGSAEGNILVNQTLSIRINRGNMSTQQGPNSYLITERPITKDESESLLTSWGAATLYVVGSIIYSDNLGETHKVRICASGDHEQHGIRDIRHRRRLIPCSDNNTLEY
jgi:hypothetical protein